MGLFSKTNKVDNKKELNWINLDNLDELSKALDFTKEKTGLFFKHSTTCPISKMMFNRFINGWEENDDCPLYYVDLLAHRDVSNTLADKTGVQHESPQVIVVKEGKVIYNASHNGISVAEIQKQL